MSAESVDAYLRAAPKGTATKLRAVRAAIREAAPAADEGISYGMPHYSFRGESGVTSRLCYFGLAKGGQKIVFYTRPMFLEDLADEVRPYLSTKSSLHFMLEEPIPVRLVKKIVSIGVRVHEKGR